MDPKSLPGVVVLIATAADGEIVERAEMEYDQYYSGSTPLIDSNRHRQALGVRNIQGKVVDSSGTIQQTFENVYDRDGAYVRSRIQHADGTVCEDGSLDERT